MDTMCYGLVCCAAPCRVGRSHQVPSAGAGREARGRLPCSPDRWGAVVQARRPWTSVAFSAGPSTWTRCRPRASTRLGSLRTASPGRHAAWSGDFCMERLGVGGGGTRCALPAAQCPGRPRRPTSRRPRWDGKHLCRASTLRRADRASSGIYMMGGRGHRPISDLVAE